MSEYSSRDFENGELPADFLEEEKEEDAEVFFGADRQRLIQLSCQKIVRSKGVRGGPSLHKNLMILRVLQKARRSDASRSPSIEDDVLIPNAEEDDFQPEPEPLLDALDEELAERTSRPSLERAASTGSFIYDHAENDDSEFSDLSLSFLDSDEDVPLSSDAANSDIISSKVFAPGEVEPRVVVEENYSYETEMALRGSESPGNSDRTQDLSLNASILPAENGYLDSGPAAVNHRTHRRRRKRKMSNSPPDSNPWNCSRLKSGKRLRTRHLPGTKESHNDDCNFQLSGLISVFNSGLAGVGSGSAGPGSGFDEDDRIETGMVPDECSAEPAESNFRDSSAGSTRSLSCPSLVELKCES